MKITSDCLFHLGKDKVLKKIINTTNLPKRQKRHNVYESLVNSIISQQLSVKAAASIFERFKGFYEGQVPSPEQIKLTSIDDLRLLGLSYQKASYLHNLALFFSNRPIDNKYWLKKTDDEIIDELTQIKGVGVWTVQMVLIFTLMREDVLPLDDLIIRNSMIQYYKIHNVNNKEKVANMYKIAAKWSPYRTIACLYLWAAKDQLK
jgi:DNA-3-methyladenine glycosylase II